MRTAARPSGRHDHTLTKLRCATCAAAICPQCFVKTEVGLKCRTCATPTWVRPDSRWRARTIGIAISAAVLLVLGTVVAVTRAGDSERSAEPLAPETVPPLPSVPPLATDPRISVYAVPGVAIGLTAGPDGAMWFTSPSTNSIGRVTAGGVPKYYTDSTIRSPTQIVSGP